MRKVAHKCQNGHHISTCPEIVCHHCGYKGHIAIDCGGVNQTDRRSGRDDRGYGGDHDSDDSNHSERSSLRLNSRQTELRKVDSNCRTANQHDAIKNFEKILRVSGINVNFNLDTGSSVTVLTYETYRSLDIPLYDYDVLLCAANGKRMVVYGSVRIYISSKNKRTSCVAYVVKGASKNLLGTDQIIDLGLLEIVNSVGAEAFDPLTKYPKLFEGLGTMPGIFNIKLKPDTVPVNLYAPRSIPAGLREKAKEQIDKMLKLDVIESVEEPTEWCSGLTIVPKQNGSIRMCVDLTALNKGVKRAVYPLPKVSEMLSQLARGRVFSKLDANSGFWQVRLDPACRKLTTFVTPWGRYCFKRMPFGISSAPEFFQRTMESILKGLDGVICLMDDVLVYAEDYVTHWRILQSVLCRLESSGITLHKEKCEFGVKSIKFLGHIVSGKGIKPDPEKVKAIAEMNPPNTKKEARQLMGMVNYLSKFSRNLSELCTPIYAVMGVKSEWYWGAEQQKSFDLIKAELSDVPVLCAFDMSCKHRVSADSSQYAVGAVLLQYNSRNEWQPVEYASRKLTEAERRYAMIEKEALAITWACEKFNYYLLGREFEVETDHKPLVSILGEKDLSQLPLRVQRFKLRMMRYSYTIFHTPGNKMYLADSLSRPCDVDGGSTKLCALVEQFVDCSVRNLLSEVREHELLQAIMRDETSQKCLQYIVRGWPARTELVGELGKLCTSRDELTAWNGFIMFQNRLYVPSELRPAYLSRLHENHQGVEKCRRRARELVWWPGVGSDIAKYVTDCDVCTKHSVIKHQPLSLTPLPSGPWEEVATDVFEFTGRLYLVIVDYYTRWIEAVPISAQTSGVVVSALSSVFSTYGVPHVLRSDNGPCFASCEFGSFVETWGFKHLTSSPRYPQSNGMAERAVKTVKRLWKMSDDKVGALLTYRSTPLKSGFSPGQLMFGRPIRSKLGKPNIHVDYDDFERYERDDREKVSAEWDRKHRAKTLAALRPGQCVWVNAPGDVGKEGTIVRVDKNPDSYWVKVGQSEIRRNRKHLFVLNDGHNDFSNDHGIRPFELDHDDDVRVPNVAVPSDRIRPFELDQDEGVRLPNVAVLSEFDSPDVISSSPNCHTPIADSVLRHNHSPCSVGSAGSGNTPSGRSLITDRDTPSAGNLAQPISNPNNMNRSVHFDVTIDEPSLQERVPAEPDPVVRTRSGRVSRPSRRDGYIYY